jgi:hypothetical protein
MPVPTKAKRILFVIFVDPLVQRYAWRAYAAENFTCQGIYTVRTMQDKHLPDARDQDSSVSIR